jgi:predicted CXXCH cytochrome family protein
MRPERFIIVVILGAIGALEARAQPAAPVGLSLLANNGAMKAVTFYGNPARFVNEIDLVFTTAAQASDLGIEPIKTFTGVADLDWTGIKMVDEDWRATGNTFKRQRFYRNAKWMNATSPFTLTAVDALGKRVGQELKVQAGRDDLAGSGDMFVRRFVARQIANGCKSQGNCDGAEFSTQALVQLRVNKNPRASAALIPADAAVLELRWSQNPKAVFKAEIRHAPEASAPSAYGFAVGLNLPKPSNGKYFMPGESMTFRVAFKDGHGQELFPDHQLPTYGQFVRDEVPTGLGYYSNRIDSTVYYALKHREANILVALSGPLEKLHIPKSLLNGERLLDPEAVTATVATDGFSSVFAGLPNFSISLGPPAGMNRPVTDLVTLRVPVDAQAGTYVAAVKSRRVFGGEALNRAGVAFFQVGTTSPTTFTPSTGHCESCHQGATSFANILHGVSDRRACYGCHMGLSFEPDNALDFRVHSIHSRSRRFNANVQQCSVCHLSPVKGPAHGLLAHAGF